jgi:hypothetical protein
MDKMTNEEAIAIIRKEYLCVDRDCDIERSCGKCDLVMPSKEPILQAYKLAIKALEQEPCEDAISRQAAIDAIKKLHSIETEYDCTLYEKLDVIYELEALPPVTPQYTEAEIQKMQDLEFAEIQKAYEIGKAENIDVLDKIRAEIEAKCCITVGRENDGAITLHDVFEIIDKYKASPTGAEGSKE